MAAWPSTHDDMLRDLYGQGVPLSGIAASLNATFETAYSRNAAIGRASRLGLTRGKPIKRTADRLAKPKVKLVEVAPAPEPSEPPAPAAAAPSRKARPLSLHELRANTCRWPLWANHAPAPLASEPAYCGDPVEMGVDAHGRPKAKPYCESCAARAYDTRRSVRRAA